jgi:hypothetical protein
MSSAHAIRHNQFADDRYPLWLVTRKAACPKEQTHGRKESIAAAFTENRRARTAAIAFDSKSWSPPQLPPSSTKGLESGESLPGAIPTRIRVKCSLPECAALPDIARDWAFFSLLFAIVPGAFCAIVSRMKVTAICSNGASR